MPDSAAARLSELLAPTRRLALVGLAKNTGKTETLAAILAEHARAGVRVGVTSIGRDGEAHDVIDARIAKPAVRLQAGDLVASTGALLRASGVSHERLVRTRIRTPLGEVVIARLLHAGSLEVAGPSAASDAHAVCEAMLELGAEQVLIDGAVDRRAASSPAVADGLVMATGAVLGEDVERVVSATGEAVELVQLPRAPDGEAGVLVERELVLGGEPEQIAALLESHRGADTLRVHGALSERFLEGLVAARGQRPADGLRVVAEDPTRVFLSRHGPGWYGRQGLALEVLRPISLRAITVNPVAPQSHSFDSERLRAAIAAAVGEVPVFDVREGS
ncbi:MAG TPA: hypothetical protein VNZ05_09385 [Solirubrobacteraceae bacterium]|nr:hypothetical protein [Solirubrobacteraceae bacterium]